MRDEVHMVLAKFDHARGLPRAFSVLYHESLMINPHRDRNDQWPNGLFAPGIAAARGLTHLLDHELPVTYALVWRMPSLAARTIYSDARNASAWMVSVG